MIFPNQNYYLIQKRVLKSFEFFLENFGDYNHAAFMALCKETEADFASGVAKD